MNLRDWIARDHALVLGRFESAIGRHVPVERWRDDGGGASIAWLLFHSTYHQDLAMNVAIRNHEPLLVAHRNDLGIGDFPPAAGLTEAENSDVTDALDLEHLQVYAEAVNHSTAQWIEKLSAMALDSIPSNSYRLEHRAGIPADGDMDWLHQMWAGKPVSWLVQWECIGHGHAHVGEMVGVRNRLGLSPF